MDSSGYDRDIVCFLGTLYDVAFGRYDAADSDAKIGDKAPHVEGNLPQEVTPIASGTITASDGLTKKS